MIYPKLTRSWNSCLAKLGSQTCDIGKKLYEAVLKIINKRRDPKVAGLLRYLDNPEDYYDDTEESALDYPTKNELAKVAKDLYLRPSPFTELLTTW